MNGRAIKTFVGLAIVLAIVFVAARPVATQERRPAESSLVAENALSPLPPFLEVFQSVHRVLIAASNPGWTSATGTHYGYLARASNGQRLPIVILIGEHDASDFLMHAAYELAEVGYLAFVIYLDDTETKPNQDGAADNSDTPQQSIARAAVYERRLNHLSAAVRWLRHRDDVFPDRVGVIGWGNCAGLAFELAADQHVQACVLCDGDLPLNVDAATASQLRRTSVALLRGVAGESLLEGEKLARFQRLLDAAEIENRSFRFEKAKAGFMDPDQRQTFDLGSADHAWFEIYEFLGKGSALF